MYKNNMNYQRDEHRVHLIVYHLIWCPKRRKKILQGQIAKDCEAIIRDKASIKGWDILELAMQPDHIHLFIRVFPSDSAADVIKEMKGAAHHLNLTSPELSKMPSVWTRSYFASTAGNVSQETIQRYIEAQKGN